MASKKRNSNRTNQDNPSAAANTEGQIANWTSGDEKLDHLLRALIDTIPAGIIVSNKKGQILLSNLAASDILKDCLAGTAHGIGGCCTFHHQDGTPFTFNELPFFRAIEKGETTPGKEMLVRWEDGSERMIFTSCSPIRDAKNRVLYALEVFQDLTERQMTAKALGKSEQRFRSIYEESPIAIEIFDAEGLLIGANKACLDMFGVPSISEILGFRIFEDPNVSEAAKARLRKGDTVKYEAPFDFEKVRRSDLYRTTKTGTIHLDVVITPISSATAGITSGYLVQIQDITERTLARAASQKIRDDLETTVQRRTAELALSNQNLKSEIDERKRTEETLRESEARFRKVFEEGPLGMTIVGTDYRFLRANAMACRIFGYTEEELTKTSFIEVTYPEDIEKTISCSRRLFGGEIPYFQIDKRFVRKDGQVIWANLTVSLVRDAEGKASYGLGMIQEITERKRAEETLRESEERYRTLLHSIPQKVFYKDRNSTYIAVNSSYAKDFNLLPADFVGKTDFDFFPQEFADKYRADDQRIMETATPEELDESYVSDGEKRIVHTQKTAVRDDKGNVVGILGIFWDITERKRADEERDRLLKDVQQLVRDSRRRATELETTIGSIVDAVFVCDKDGLIVDINKTGLALLGMKTRPEFFRPTVDYLRLLGLRHTNGEPIGIDELALVRALQGGVVRGYEEIARDPLTHRDIHLLVSAAPIHDQEGSTVGAVEVMSDITRMRELDKLKDEFITVAAHELKTPVAIMKGYAQALLRSTEEPGPRNRKMLDAINRGSDKIDGIVKDLLDISRLYLGRLELAVDRVDLIELAEEVVDRMAAVAKRHRIHLAKTEPVIVQGDRDRLEQVLTNLLDNAIRYSPSGGDIEVKVDAQDGEAIVSVNDQGVGISVEKQERIFERFYRAHTGTPYDYGGMGVGLYISREIVLRHGGRMWFESEEKKGSTFFFSLPLQGEHAGT